MPRSLSARLLLPAVAFLHPQGVGGSRFNAAAPRSSPTPSVPRSLAAASASSSRRGTASAASSLEALASAVDASSLEGSVSSLMRDVRGVMAGGPRWIASWAKPMPKCVSSVSATVHRLERSYGRPQVPSLLVHSCDSPEVYRDVGGTQPGCVTLMRDLGKVYGECGDQNYYTWCRNLYLNSSTTVKNKMKEFKWITPDNKPNGSANKTWCERDCPEIASVITDLAVFSRVLEELLGEMVQLFMGGPEARDQLDLVSMHERLELLLRLDNRMCDNVHFAKPTCARPTLMTESCRSFEDEAVQASMWFSKYMVEGKFMECDQRQPCRNVCEGVDAKRVDYFAAGLWAASAKAVPSYAEGKAFCDSIPHLAECAAQPSCEEYLAFQAQDAITAQTLKEQQQLVCNDVFLDGCYQVQEKKCWREIQVMNKPFKDHQYHCREVLEHAHRYTDKEVEACCQASLDLAHCNGKNWCHGFMEKEINASGLVGQFESLCPQVLWALTTTTTPAPFDCEAGLANYEKGWSAEKKTWCCDNEAKACGLFDCQAGLSNWERGWSEEKKVWCCSEDGVGCTTTPPPDPFDCREGVNNWKRGWSDPKKDWCCSHRNLGCPGQPSPGVGHKSPLV
mmetsp:Transcript_32616/g.85576  ORF Transcript_32616/g.85576 Transcript_32616/m.85576 type:complete len:621 (+) Transcript_32616:53-1915(+)